MAKAVDQRDPSLFRFAAHAFKSAANNIGANQLSSLCGRLEKITEAEFNEKGRIYLVQVERELDRVKAELGEIAAVERRSGAA
jgi:HPt (histidine-containing phosphotransfer) domain-containing protein